MWATVYSSVNVEMVIILEFKAAVSFSSQRTDKGWHSFTHSATLTAS